MHGKDFGMEAKYHFFAKSHGTNLCSGVGGAINRFAAHPSLPTEVQNQILNPYQIYSFAKSSIHNITCFFVDKHQIEVISKFLFYRFEKTKNIKTNWRQHFNLQNFRGRFCSNIFDQRFTSYTKYCRSNTKKVLCLLFWKGLVFWDSKLCFYWERQCQYQILAPKGPASKYFWSSNTDVCWIPHENVACEENPPVWQDISDLYKGMLKI